MKNEIIAVLLCIGISFLVHFSSKADGSPFAPVPVELPRCAEPDTVGSHSATMVDPSSWNLTARNLTEESEVSENFDLLDYENLDIGMKVKYPSHWNKTEDTYSPPSVMENAPFPSVLFAPPSQNDYQQPCTGLWIFSYATDRTLDEEVKQTISNYNVSTSWDFDSFELLEDPINVTISSLPFQVLNYSYTNTNTDTEENAVEFITKSNDKIYRILYSAEVNDFPKFMSEIQQILHSFEPNPYNAIIVDKIFGNYTAGVLLTLPDEDPWSIKDLSNNTIGLLAHGNGDSPFTLTLSAIRDVRSIPEIIKNETRNNMSNVVYSNLTFLTTKGGEVPANKVEFNNTNYYAKILVYAIENNTNNINTAYIYKYVEGFPTVNSSTVQAIIDSTKIVDFVQTGNTILKRYVYPDLEFDMAFPSDWEVEKTGMGITASPYDASAEFQVSIGPRGLNELDDVVASDISNWKEQYEDFQILESSRADLGDNESHKIVYKFGPPGDLGKGITYYALHGNIVYYFSFSAPIEEYPGYMPIIDKIFDSIHFNMKSNPSERTQASSVGMKLGSPPIDLVINPLTNKLYVAPSDTNMLFVLNATSNVIMSNVTIGGLPNALAINPITNTIYATSPVTDKIYVIDGSTDKLIQNISAGPYVGDMAVDSDDFNPAGLIFVTNQGILNEGQNRISIIDGLTNKVEKNVTIGDSQPIGIGLDPITNRAYVAGSTNGSIPIVSVIDYSIDSNRTVLAKKVGEVFNYTGLFPQSIVVDPKTSAVYVANSGGDTVTVIDGNTSEIINTIPVGFFPNSVAINPNTSKVYATSTGQNILSVIDLSLNASGSNPIQVDSPTFDASINPETNMIYSANPKSKTISTVSGDIDKLVATLRFHITPPKSGSIKCGENEFAPETYVKVPLGTKCDGVPNHNFKFDSWSTLRGSNSTSQKLNVSSDGTYTASFLPADTAASYFEILSPYVSIIILVIILVLASIPSVFARLKKLLPLRGLEHVSHKDIDIIGTDSTVIAGLLVFLTLSNFQGSELIQLAIITVNVIFPFAASVISTLLNKKEYAIRLMSAGFIYLIISVIMIAVLLMP